MNKTALYGTLLVALGLAAGVAVGRRGDRDHAARREGDVVVASRRTAGNGETESGDRQALRLEQRLELLGSKLAAETAERRRLEERIEVLATALAEQHPHHQETLSTVAPKPEQGPAAQVAAASGGAADPTNAKDGAMTTERALLAAGIDAPTATEIKRRQDEIALSEIYLRDLATREGWADTPRFGEEMAEIQRQRTSIRDQIGDDAYDRYLAALDHPNRVAVDEVLLESPAAVAGVQAGDLVLRYGDTRIFAPEELVNATRGGIAGETVRLEIMRQGQPVQIDVPRGPLGVRIAASRGNPAGS